MGNYEKVVEPRLDDIRKWVQKGATEKEIAKALGISYSGFRLYKKENPQLLGILVENKRQADETALGAFYSRVTGYTYEEEKKVKIDGQFVTVEKTTKHIPPDVSAGKFWLSNTKPEQFKNRQTVEGELNVSKTLEDFIDDV